MGSKVRHVAFNIELPYDDVVNKTLQFWQGNKTHTDVTKNEDLPGGVGKALHISQKPSFTSWGQDYEMEIKKGANGTEFSVGVNMAFGGGMQWSKPLETMKELIKMLTGQKVKLKWLD
jgi:hypothetical protein